jgi:hypothetical protein
MAERANIPPLRLAINGRVQLGGIESPKEVVRKGLANRR